ncbi:MAG TPA: MBL fold metallo-hydrolase [Burkholderiaceae bacterium]|nr:MBL fold metallo-hydrolase [Burkholderiaceae bacterium]
MSINPTDLQDPRDRGPRARARRWCWGAIGATAAALLLLACADKPAAVADNGSHYRDGSFHNNYVDFQPRGLMTLARWKFEAWRSGVPAPASSPTPAIVPDLGLVQSNAKAGARMLPTVTWIGHATVLAQLAGLNVLTDPIFSERASPLSFMGPVRAQKPGLLLHELPRIDLVLISHNHYDHLDDDSVRALARQSGGAPLFVVPLGLKAWFAQRDIVNVVELDWWQSHRVGEIEVVLTPVQHWSGRHLTDRMETLWGGYALLAQQLHLFFAGDTGYSKDFADIRAHFAQRQGAAQGGGFDLALLPIGGYEPRWFMRDQHINPDEAVRIHRDLGAKASLGIHWGTFELTDESLDTPPRDLARARQAQGLPESAFFTLAIGQTRRLAPRRPGG